MKLKPVMYQWKKNPAAGDKIGLNCTGLLIVIPEVVKTWDYEIGDIDESLAKVPLDRLGVY